MQPDHPPARRRRPTTRLTVTRREQLSPSMVRVVFTVEAFAYQGFADSYVKLLFDEHGPLREEISDRPMLRTYTVRHYDDVTKEVTIDFVIHGSEGLAGPWAAHCQPGDALLARGPGGKWSPIADAAFHLFVGDESALPAIESGLERLDHDARGLVIVETQHYTRQLAAPAGVDVRWIVRGNEAYRPERLADEVARLPWPELHDVSVFAHGERGAVKALRRVLRDAEVPAERLSISGYWAFGRTEPEFQAEKRTAIGKI